ncbi:MAG TPA: hypothetical protein VF702_00445 [Allosphingosinicella sp.]|jgi:hypothetical protein
MSARAALLLAAAALGSGCAASRPPLDAYDDSGGAFECFAEARDPFGRIAFDAQLDLDEAIIYHNARWVPARRPRPASISEVHFHWTTPPAADNGAHVTLGVTTQRWFEGEARLVLRGQSVPPSELESFYRRDVPPVSRGARLYEDRVPLAALRAAMGETGRAQLALVGADGADLAARWIEAASLAQADEALAGLRPAIARVLADPARNCRPPRLIVVRGS